LTNGLFFFIVTGHGRTPAVKTWRTVMKKIAGLFLGELTIPLAIVTWLVSFFL